MEDTRKKKGSLLKKLTATLVGALFVASMLPTTALADPLPPSTGSLTIHKYVMPDTTAAAGPNNGYEAGTQGNPAVPADATPLNDITFNIYLVTPNTTPGGQTVTDVYPTTGPFRLNTAGTKMTDNAGTEWNVTAASPASVTTATVGGVDGIATASGLAQGFYLIVEQPDTTGTVTTPAEPFVVPVPMTNPTEDGWITDVHVYPKNESADVSKVPSSVPSVAIGQTISYVIQPSVPTAITADDATEDDAIKYKITDVLDSALDFTANSVTIKGKLTSTATATNTIAATGNYTVAYDSGTRTLTIEFTKAGRQVLKTGSGTEAWKFLEVAFDATVNSNITSKTNYTVENQATVDFTNQFGTESQYKTGKPKIHSAAIKLTKKDAATANNLKDAEFQIASSEANAKAGKYLKKNADGDILDDGDTGYAAATAWIETSADTTGIVEFKGLQDYTADVDVFGVETNKVYRSYWLVETKAPDGYSLLNAPIKAEFSATNATEALSYTIDLGTVNNSDKPTLPNTGGVGTLLFTIGGIVLVGLAGIFYIASNKRKKKASKISIL